MNAITAELTIGMDIAKSVFQVHVEDARGRVLEQRRLRRSQVEAYFKRRAGRALVGIEACGTGHYWARRLRALGCEVRLIPTAYVKPFVRRNKTDARDAAAICTALKQPDMRFVPIKSAESQAARAVEGSRELLVKQRTQLNSLRSQLAEHGVVAAQGRRGSATLAQLVLAGDERLPQLLIAALRPLAELIARVEAAVAELDKHIVARAKADPAMRRLATIPGVGPLLAHAIVTAIGDGRQFASARAFAAWAGLTPRGYSSGGKHRNKGISRQGDSRLRKLFTLGASTVMRYARARGERATQWQYAILARRPVKVAVVAQAAKTARIAWAMLVSGQIYQPQRQAPTREAA